MRVTFSAVFTEEDDGVDGDVAISRENIEDVYGMAQFMTSAMNAAGFSYVNDTGFTYNSGKEVWGEKF